MSGRCPDHRISAEVRARIESERAYHEEFYDRQEVSVELAFDLSTEERRRPQSLTWAYYDRIVDKLGGNLTGKRILVVGCGTGLVALNLVRQGASVHAIDVSEKAIAICRRRAVHNGLSDNIELTTSSYEELPSKAEAYDAVVGEMILHHLDIPIAMRTTKRVLRPGGAGVFMEWKVYPIIDRVRALPALRRWLPPGGYDNYATEYERKLSRRDLDICRQYFSSLRLEYRYCMRGKLDYFFPPRVAAKVDRLDYWILRTFPILNAFSDAVVISFTKGTD